MGELLALKIPSDPERLPEIEEFAERAGKAAGLDEHRCSMLGLVVTEAANNSIHHGNRGDPSLPVEISIVPHDNYLTITVKDTGHGFDPNLLPDPTAPENLMRDHGRGFLILRHFCRTVSTEKLADGFITIMQFDRIEPDEQPLG